MPVSVREVGFDGVGFWSVSEVSLRYLNVFVGYFGSCGLWAIYSMPLGCLQHICDVFEGYL